MRPKHLIPHPGHDNLVDYVVRGAGGGGGKGGGGDSAPATPTEDPDTLQAKAYARVVDFIGEGEIGGLVGGMKGVYLNKTPLQNSDGSLNFDGLVSFYSRNGTPDQLPAPGFNTVESPVGVGVEVRVDQGPVVRSLIDSGVRRARVDIRVPSLFDTDTSTGDVHGSSVSFKIEARTQGKPYVQVKTGSWTSVANGTKSSVGCTGLKVSAVAEKSVVVPLGSVSGQPSYPEAPTIEYRKVGTSTWVKMPVSSTSKTGRQEKLGTRLNQMELVSRTIVNAVVSALAIGTYEYRVLNGSVFSADEFDSTSTTISGKCTSDYSRSYDFDLPGTGPWDVRVSRVTADSTKATLSNATFWDTLTLIEDQPLTYPGSAYTAFEVDAQGFGGSIPDRAYLVDGLKIRVPSNYNTTTRAYSGNWDGTFKMALNGPGGHNPAWVLFDILTNETYGLGEFIEDSQIDTAALYTIAKYCDQMVPDGYGGTEPRFAFNGVISTQAEAYDVLNAIATAFRGMIYWASGAITVVQDCPRDVDLLVGRANTVSSFNYESSSRKARHNSVSVAFNDPGDFYNTGYELVEDNDDIIARGMLQASLATVGCTSRGLAHRLGKWLIYTERYEREVVTYDASFDHGFVSPGMIVGVVDPSYTGADLAGRLVDADGNIAVVDRPITIQSGKTYQLAVIGKDLKVHWLDVLDGPGTYTSLNLSDALPATAQQAFFAVVPSDVQPRQFRVMSAAETAPNKYTLTGTLFYPGKFDLIEKDIALPKVSYSQLTTGAVKRPGAISVQETLYLANAQVKTRLSVGWGKSADTRVTSYKLSWRNQRGNWQSQQTVETSYEIDDVADGTYDFEVRAVSPVGTSAASTLYSHEVLGKSAPPDDVVNLAAVRQVTGVTLSWDAVTDLDLVGYEVRVGATWDSAAVVSTKHVATTLFVPISDANKHTFQVRALDSTGNYSTHAATIVSSVVPPPDVANFQITPKQNDNLQFTWDNQPDAGTVYEIRVGLTWSLAQVVGVAASSPFQTLYPAAGEKFFWVKAKSAAGLYSPDGYFTEAVYDLYADVNEVLTYDNQADTTDGDNYSGFKYLMVVDGTGAAIYLDSVDTGLAFKQGEHYFDVDLGDTFTARNWMVADAAFLTSSGRTWGDLGDVEWADATFPWIDDNGEVAVTSVISIKQGSLDASDLYGWGLDGTTTDFRGVTATEADGVGYEDGRHGTGVVLGDFTKLSWQSLTLGSTFLWGAHLRVRDALYHEGAINVLAVMKDGSGHFLKVIYDSYDRSVHVVDEADRDVVVPVGRLTDDEVLFVGVSQSGTTRQVYCKTVQSGYSSASSGAYAPTGSFTELYMYDAA